MNQYLKEIKTAWDDYDGQLLASLLSLKHAHALNTRLYVEEPEALIQRVLDTPINELVACHIKCLGCLSRRSFKDAYQYQSALVQAFTKLLQSQKDENWALPIMYVICIDLRKVAVQGDLESTRKNVAKPGEMLEKAAECVMGCFRVCAADNRSSEDETKRWGMLNLVNQLFKIYFRINKLHLCKPLIRAIEASPFKAQFSLSQLVTYRYYVGRKAMFDSDFRGAEEYLTFAFQRCHRECRNNKRLILIYLIPVKMLLGHMPSSVLLAKYDLLEFSQVVAAVKEGNFRKLNQALVAHEAFFIRQGIYLILEKLRTIAYRNLFKKVSLLTKMHQIPIHAFFTALQFAGEEDVDEDETECILANLVYDNKIKGYLSKAHKKLVVSKQNAFPPLASAS